MIDTIYAVYGSSGFGREVIPILRDMLLSKIRCEIIFVDDNSIALNINGFRVLSYQQYLELDANTKYISIAIADVRVRENITFKCLSDGLKIWDIKAGNSIVLDQVDLGAGSILCPFVTLTSNVKVGKSFHANIYSYVAHDCIIGDFVTFAPRVSCNGNVFVSDYVYIGTGAVIKQGKSNDPLIIGEGAIIGMGAVVTKNIPPGTTVIGNPAKPLSKQSVNR